MFKSSGFIKFAVIVFTVTAFLALCSCKGRTMENMTPSGNTIEVTIMQTNVSDTTQNQIN